MNLKQYAPWMVARLFLGSVFVVSGFLKLAEPVENFRGMILAYGVIPYTWAIPAAIVMPWLEFFSGACLLVGYFPRVFSGVLGLLALSFIGLITLSKLHGTLPANCGCFGDNVHMSPYQMVVLDSLNFLIALRLFQIKAHRLCVCLN